MKRTIAGVSAFAFMWALAWIAGYNFDTRNAGVAYWLFCSVVAGIFAAACPVFDKG